MLLHVRLVPGASQNNVVGTETADHKTVYKIRLTAPPIDGRANEALIQFLAKQLQIAPSTITLDRGATSKHKTLSVPLPDQIVHERLAKK